MENTKLNKQAVEYLILYAAEAEVYEGRNRIRRSGPGKRKRDGRVDFPGTGGQAWQLCRPIFTVFRNMEEVQQEVRHGARERFAGYAQKAVHYTPPLKQMGMQMLLFAREEPRLYELLFMKNEGKPHVLDEGNLSGGTSAMPAMEMIHKDYGLTYEEARKLFHYVWIFTFGVGALCATGACRFSDEELNELLGQDFMAMLARIKSASPPSTQP